MATRKKRLAWEVNIQDRHIEIVRCFSVFIVFIDRADKLAIQQNLD